MDGREDKSVVRRCPMLLLMFLSLVMTSGCIPVLTMNEWPVPKSYGRYLPPDEKDDVLLVSIYDKSNCEKDVAGDVQLLSYPYDNAKLGATVDMGITSVTWGTGYYRRRVRIYLFTKSGKAICIPLRPFEAHDNALSYFLVMDNPPLREEDFLDFNDKREHPVFKCISLGDFNEEYRGTDVEYLWESREAAMLAREFWRSRKVASSKQSGTAEFWRDGQQTSNNSSGAIWKLHSIFGESQRELQAK